MYRYCLCDRPCWHLTEMGMVVRWQGRGRLLWLSKEKLQTGESGWLYILLQALARFIAALSRRQECYAIRCRWSGLEGLIVPVKG